MKRGYFLITLFYLPGFRGEPCIYLSLLLARASGTLWVLPDMHLGSFHCLLPVGLCFPIPAQLDGSLPHFRPRAKHKCCSCPSAMLAEFPWLLNNSRLFPGGLRELQVKFSLQGSALFSVAPGAGVEYACRCPAFPSPSASITACVTCVVLWEAESPSPTKSPRWHPKSSHFPPIPGPFCKGHSSDHSATLLTLTCFSAPKPVYDQKLKMLGLQVLPSAITPVFH